MKKLFILFACILLAYSAQAQGKFKALPALITPPMGLNVSTGDVDFEVSGGPGLSFGSYDEGKQEYVPFAFGILTNVSVFLALGGSTADGDKVTFSAGGTTSIYWDWLQIGYRRNFTEKSDLLLLGYKAQLNF